MGRIYLDYNSTTPLAPEAEEAMRPFAAGVFGNPASAHFEGRKARQALEDAREKVAALLGAEPDEVLFTSGATESNNLALFGLAGDTGHIAASPIEHPSVSEPLKQLANQGRTIDWLPMTPRGIIDAAAGAGLIRPETQLVSLVLVNHETGAIQPVREMARGLAGRVLFHTDAAQAVGKVAVCFREMGVAALTASGHKFGGPKGIGLLLLKRGIPLRPLLFGGHQQQGRRPGTEPVALAVGLAAALELAVRTLEVNRARLEELRSRFWQRIQAVASPVVLNGPEPSSPDVVPTTLNVSFPGCRADLLLIALDLAGVACSAGSACSSGSLLPSPVLQAMAIPEEMLRSAIRFSFGPDQDGAELEEAASRIGTAVARMRAASRLNPRPRSAQSSGSLENIRSQGVARAQGRFPDIS